MDPQAQGLEFLDWSSIPEQDRFLLQSILYPGVSPPDNPPAAVPETTSSWADEVQAEDDAAAAAVQEQNWEQQHSPQHQEYGEMSPPPVVPPPAPSRGGNPPVTMYAPMIPPPHVTNVMPPQSAGPPQPNVNAIYPLIMQGQPGMIVGNVNLSVNANVQSYVTPMSTGYQYDYDNKDKRRGGVGLKPNKPKRDYNKMAEEQQQQQQTGQFQHPSFIYPPNQYVSFVPHHPPTAQHVSGTPLFINSYNTNPQAQHHQPQIFYNPQHMYIPMHAMPPVPMQQQQEHPMPPVSMPQDLSMSAVTIPPQELSPVVAMQQDPHPPINMQQDPHPPINMQQPELPIPVVVPMQNEAPIQTIQQEQQPMVPLQSGGENHLVPTIIQTVIHQEHSIQSEHSIIVPPPVQNEIQPPPAVMLQPNEFPVPAVPDVPLEQPPPPPEEVVVVVEDTPVEKELVIEETVTSFEMQELKEVLPEPPKEPSPPPAPAPVAAPLKSWASIVQSSNSGTNPQESSKPLARVGPFTPAPVAAPPTSAPISGHKNRQHQQDNVTPQQGAPLIQMKGHTPEQDQLFIDDPMLYRLGEHLCKYTLDHRSSALQPRGLTNRSNWCYVNATLQALLACPPFYNLMRHLPIKQQNYSRSGHRQSQSKSTTPITDAIVEFMQQFNTLPPGSRPARKEKAAARRAGQGGESEVTVDVPQGPAFEPSCIYNMLASIRSTAFSAVEGRQEDAEEFLSCLLNALNDEMLELMKLVDEPSTGLSNGQPMETVTNGEVNHGPEEDSDQWTVMRGKNRACLTRRSDFGRTPVSDIFRGQLCSHVQRKGDQQSETVQPFYTLQLDIEKARSVREALEQMVDKDWLEGVTCSKTQQQVEAWQQVTLEELPPVLLLHLKWFDYKQDGCSKIMKNMDYSVDLRIENKLLSKTKYSMRQRHYKLFAVVYHDGKEASKGHYITDAYHSAMGVWVRYDDSQVRVVSEYTVTHPRSPAVPYILYYRRSDTMGLPSVKNQEN